MPRILFPFTRAKLNSIARLPWREGKKVMIVTVGMKQRPRYVVPEHQAPVDVLMSLCDLVIPIFAHEITKVNKVILNFHQCFSSKIPKRYTLLKTVCSMKLKFRIPKRLKKRGKEINTQRYYLSASTVKNVIYSHQTLLLHPLQPKDDVTYIERYTSD